MTDTRAGGFATHVGTDDPARRMLFGSPAAQVATWVARTQEQLLMATERLSEEQMAWRPNSDAPPIQFHLWHIARYADRFQVTVAKAVRSVTQQPGPQREIWEAEELAARWGLTGQAVDPSATGWGMDDHLAADLRLPPKEQQLDYARRAFAAADALAAEVVDLALFEREFVDHRGRAASVGSGMLGYLTHAGRHLGMIEALTGAQGMRGTATI
jgi:hypothetical protein